MQLNFLNPEYLFQKVYEFLVGITLLPLLLSGAENLLEFLGNIERISTGVSLMLLVGIGYSLIRMRQIRAREAAAFAGLAEVAPQPLPDTIDETQRNPKWDKVLEHISSSNAADWRLAILEADILLDELLDALRYRGESIGEKLKKIEASDFASLDAAWEAHKIRNQVAHEGSEFLLSEREAKRVIALYEEVFKEFRFI